jgi:hypothetical protein
MEYQINGYRDSGGAHGTLIVSPSNYEGPTNNKLMDKIFECGYFLIALCLSISVNWPNP